MATEAEALKIAVASLAAERDRFSANWVHARDEWHKTAELLDAAVELLSSLGTEARGGCPFCYMARRGDHFEGCAVGTFLDRVAYRRPLAR